MRRAYLLVYSATLGTREEIKECLNTLSEVITWRYDLPNAFYIISEEDAKSLAQAIRKCRGDKGRFLVTEVSDNKGGWMPPGTWYLLREKRLKPKE